MSTSSQSRSPTPLLESSATRVFQIPELVGLVLEDWTQPQLALVAGVSTTFAAECRRVLYKSPWIDNVIGYDTRIDKLAQSLTDIIRRNLAKFNDLGLGFDHDFSPNSPQLGRLFRTCRPLKQLELAGQSRVGLMRESLLKMSELTNRPTVTVTGLTYISAPAVENALHPAAARLVNLTLHFANPLSSAGSVTVSNILTAYVNLRYLSLKNSDLDRFSPSIEPPSYTLTHLSLRRPVGLGPFELQPFTWLLGSSQATLASFSGGRLSQQVLNRLPQLTPQLKRASVHIQAQLSGELEAAVQVAAMATVQRITVRAYIVPRNDHESLAQARSRAAGAVEALEEASRAKVTVEYVA